MKTFHKAIAAALFAGLCLTSPVQAGVSPEVAKIMSAGGLQEIKVRDIDFAYALPGASLKDYNSFIVDPVEVAFAKDWNPTPAGTAFPISAANKAAILAKMAKLVHAAFVKELQKKSDYTVVTTPGPGVLGIKIYVINLYVTAPDTMQAGMTTTFTTSAGSATLVLQLYDPLTGRVLARAMDSQSAQNNDGPMVANSVTNQFEAEQIVDQWAGIMRKELDAAHDIGKR